MTTSTLTEINVFLEVAMQAIGEGDSTEAWLDALCRAEDSEPDVSDSRDALISQLKATATSFYGEQENYREIVAAREKLEIAASEEFCVDGDWCILNPAHPGNCDGTYELWLRK